MQIMVTCIRWRITTILRITNETLYKLSTIATLLEDDRMALKHAQVPVILSIRQSNYLDS